MNLESQVTSLELSKLLKELGIKQESLFYWEKCSHFSHDNNFVVIYEETHDLITYEFGDCHVIHSSHEETYSAFTASELLELLPEDIYNSYQLKIEKEFGNTYRIFYEEGTYPHDKILHKEQNNSLPNVCAAMLIHLLENGLLEIR